MFAFIIAVVGFIIVAMMWTEGMWTNAITLINVVFAGIVSWSLFEPLANYLEKNIMASATYVVDFLAFWLLFALIFNVFRAVTDGISKTKVRFKKPIELAGGIVFAMLTGWVFICIACASIHLAPLARSPFRGSFYSTPKSGCFFGMTPDRYWLAFMHSRTKPKGTFAKKNAAGFDPQGTLILKYGTRRERLAEYNKKNNGTVRVQKKDLNRR